MKWNEAAALAVMVVAMASCTAATSYFEKNSAIERSKADPRTACVQAAWTQADRIECIKTSGGSR